MWFVCGGEQEDATPMSILFWGNELHIEVNENIDAFMKEKKKNLHVNDVCDSNWFVYIQNWDIKRNEKMY